VTHDQEEALALSDRVAIMNRGRLEQVGTPEEIYAAPHSRFVAEFVGLSNFLEGRVEATDGDCMVVNVGGLPVTIPVPPPATPGQAVLLFVRPNEIELLPPGTPIAGPVVEARVDKATYLGDKMDYRLTLPGGLVLRVQSDAQRRFAPGAAVRVRLPRARGWAVADPAR
jgi:ABC-type Fe3+/spermidine/putrescine transport system ATPase subunit